LLRTVGPEFEKKPSSNLWQKHTFFKPPFEMKCSCLEGIIKSLTWELKKKQKQKQKRNERKPTTSNIMLSDYIQGFV